MISTAIQQLVNYGLDTGLILPDDEIYIRNQLLMTMQLDDFTAPEGEVCYTDLESILKTLVDDAVARGVCEDNSTARDLFDTKLMGQCTIPASTSSKPGKTHFFSTGAFAIANS